MKLTKYDEHWVDENLRPVASEVRSSTSVRIQLHNANGEYVLVQSEEANARLREVLDGMCGEKPSVAERIKSRLESGMAECPLARLAALERLAEAVRINRDSLDIDGYGDVVAHLDRLNAVEQGSPAPAVAAPSAERVKALEELWAARKAHITADEVEILSVNREARRYAEAHNALLALDQREGR